MPALVFKQIKPKRLNEKALRAELQRGMDTIGKKIKNDFEKTTTTWNTKVKFEVVTDIGPSGPQVLVGTDSPIYRYVSEGTKPHVILPKTPGGKLRFQGTYTAKTVPGVIGSKQGGPSGDVVYSSGVIHPGTEARNFGVIIAQKWQNPFKREMEKALSNAAKKSGHSI